MKMARAAFIVLPATLATFWPGRGPRRLGDESWMQLRISRQAKHFGVALRRLELTAMNSDYCCLAACDFYDALPMGVPKHVDASRMARMTSGVLVKIPYPAGPVGAPSTDSSRYCSAANVDHNLPQWSILSHSIASSHLIKSESCPRLMGASAPKPTFIPME